MQQDWDHVRVFLAVARTRQFLGAARMLSIDHATVARRIAALETSLGLKLFARSTAGVFPTAEGEQFLAFAEAMESAWLAAQAELPRAGRTVAGTVRIAVPDGFGVYFLASRLGRLEQRHLGLLIQIVPLQRSFSLSKREADLAVMIDRPSDSRLTTRKLTDYSLGFYATSDYISAHGSPSTPEDLYDHVIATSVPDLHYAEALNYYPPVFEAAQRRLELAGVSAQCEAVRAGVAIGILHDYIARSQPGLIRILPALEFKRTYHLVTHADTRHVARVDEARKFIIDEVAASSELFKVHGA